MGSMLRFTTALSTLAVAGLVAGCASPFARVAEASSPVPGKTLGAAARTQLALASGDFAAAVGWAEQAVASSPRDATLRTLLGNAYLGAGRFASAEAAYMDAVALGGQEAGLAMKLVLAQIAAGRGEQAIQLLDHLRGAADPGDVGLAMALAGQPGNAIALLDEAARRPEADARTRQNLALAHALAGNWEMARVVAAQDIPADQLDARLAEWMAIAKPNNGPGQVAALLGVSPAAADPGQPARLALRETGERLAAAAAVPPVPALPAPIAEPVPAGPEMAANTTVINDPGFASTPLPEAPVAVAAAEVTVPLPAAEPASRPVESGEQLADIAGALESLRTEPVRASGRLPRISQLRRTAAARFARSGVVVQLGAYGSPARVQTAWSAIARRHSAVVRYTPASARFKATGGTVYRLSLKGFGSDREARLLCEQLKRSGSACFVRNAAGDTPVRFAAR